MNTLSGVSATSSAPQFKRAEQAAPAATNQQTKTATSTPAAAQTDPQLQQLQQRDREVRAHEQAHLSASGGLANGGPQYSYQRGSDGKNYAIGGEVSIDTSPGKTPRETISRAQTIRAAALAPADPSPQDRSVAAKAAAMEAQARLELAQQAQSGKQTGAGNKVEKAYANASQDLQPIIDIQA